MRWRRPVPPFLAKGRLVLALLALSVALGGCYLPLQLEPLQGEGPPPGFILGDLPPQYQGKRNPFTTGDAQALAEGKTLYQSYSPSCLGCHDAAGRGVGVLGAYLEPKPADFTAPLMRAAFRDHQDYVFWWVSEGVPKTSMPAWQVRLNETQRWQVITHAQWLAEQAAGQRASLAPAIAPVVGRR